MSELFDSLKDLTEIQGLIDATVRESPLLEYKRASTPFTDKEKGEIAKDISAMANSGGGVIVYGVSTDPVDRTKPIGIETLDPKNIETLDRVVNSQIKPPVSLSKKLIPQAKPQVMVIDVCGSDDPPHQSLYDHKYYRRSGTESLPMEHDLIALHFGRRLGPLLSLRFIPLNPPRHFSGDPLVSDEATIRVLLDNHGRKVGRFTDAVLLFPPVTEVSVHARSGPVTNIDALYQGKQARQFTNNEGVFHPGLSVKIVEFGFVIKKEFIDTRGQEPFVSWTVFADEMAPREGSVSLADLGWAMKSD